MAFSDPQGAALVTGASSGIGAEIARTLAARKLDLVITARRQDRLEALAAELRGSHGVTVHVVPHDLGVTGGAQSLYDAVAALGVDVSVLVNNAGFGVYGNAWEADLGRTQMMLELNMTALTTLTQLYVADMTARGGGRVLQVASVGAFQPAPYYAAYAATKAYVLFYSQALDWELRAAGVPVSVTSLCPGLTRSEFHQTAEHKVPGAMEMIKMSAADVAGSGVDAMFAARAVRTPGLMNVFNAWFIKVIPRSWATAIAGLLMRDRRGSGSAA